MFPTLRELPTHPENNFHYLITATRTEKQPTYYSFFSTQLAIKEGQIQLPDQVRPKGQPIGLATHNEAQLPFFLFFALGTLICVTHAAPTSSEVQQDDNDSAARNKEPLKLLDQIAAKSQQDDDDGDQDN